MRHLIFKRFLAWMIDWLIIAIYASALFGVMMVLSAHGVVTVGEIHPVKGQLIGFFTLTFPAMLYCMLTEAGAKHATFGKRIMKIEVAADNLSAGQVIARNAVKFLPWEFAHAGILWINYIKTPETPLWIWFLLITPQVIVVAYIMSMIATKGSASLYDKIAGTRIRHVVNHLPVALICFFVFQSVGESLI